MRRTCGICLALLGLTGLLLIVPPAPADDTDNDTVHLFNGKDLSNFYTWLGPRKKGEDPLGKNHDPDKVFTVHDGVLRISGEDWGGLVTEKEYDSYHLTVEYKWGEKTWPPREDRARDSGVMLHCVGPDGAHDGFWMQGVECQMIEGGTGDIILVAGKNKPSVTATAVQKDIGNEDNRHKEWYYLVGAPPVTLSTGRIDWYDRDEAWKDVKGFRGRKDVENDVGQWNTLECVCEGDGLTIRLNKVKVNAATKVEPSKGKILIQSEGAEVFFRKIDLRPIAKK